MEKQQKGMRLLKKGRSGIHQLIFSRMGIVLLLLILNIALLFLLFFRFEEFLPHVYGGNTIFTIGVVIYLINSKKNPNAKLAWLIIIMLFPVFGSLLYLFTCAEFGHIAMKKRLKKIYSISRTYIDDDQEACEELALLDPGAAAMTRYLSGITDMPVYQNTEAYYLSCGKELLDRLLIELNRAEHSIYLEYYIIDEGEMWGRVLEVLAEKAAGGVDVRVMYDGTCEFFRLPKSYPQKLKKLGIDCRVFSPITPFLSTHYNNRDHRKIVTIDSRVAFTGGINLADRYINAEPQYGDWKDTAVMLSGDAAKSFELMFLQIWNIHEKTISFPEPKILPKQPSGSGFAMPYFDDPLDHEPVGRQVYLDILNRATEHVYIFTPYLVLDDETESALAYAAQRGVEVVVLLPAITDNPATQALAKGHYPRLFETGVKIYEYTPGFVHAKMFLADSKEAVIGTINLDYRSLYHNFECAVYLYGSDCIKTMEADFLNSISRAKAITRESIRGEKRSVKIAAKLLKIFSPLL